MNSARRLTFRLSPGSPTANYIKELHWLPMKQRVLYKILLFALHFVHYSWKILMSLGALVFQNYKVTGCQYAYNLKVPNVKTAFGRRSFSFAVPFEWINLPFEMKLIPQESDYRKKLKTFTYYLALKALLSLEMVRKQMVRTNLHQQGLGFKARPLHQPCPQRSQQRWHGAVPSNKPNCKCFDSLWEIQFQSIVHICLKFWCFLFLSFASHASFFAYCRNL